MSEEENPAPLVEATGLGLSCLAADNSKCTPYTYGAQAVVSTAILHANDDNPQVLVRVGESTDFDTSNGASHTLYVNSSSKARSPTRRSRRLNPEQRAAIRLADDAAFFMSKRRWRLRYVTFAPYGIPENEARAAGRVFKSRLTDCQRRGGQGRRYYVEDLHGEPALHCHLLVATTEETERLLLQLAESPKFKALEARNPKKGSKIIHIRNAEPGRWFARYAEKDVRVGGNVDGSFIRLSADLKEDMQRAGIEIPPVRYRSRKSQPLKIAKGVKDEADKLAA